MRFTERFSRKPYLAGDGIYLRMPVRGDYAQWADVRRASRSFLEPWEPRWASDELTKPAFHLRLRRYNADFAEERSIALFVFRTSTDALLGGLTIGNIRRAAAQSCMIGYWMAENEAGKGLMLAALRTTIPYIFNGLKLHRIEAACIPDNRRSIRLLEKANFQYEGYLRGYLKIDGRWRDHLLFAHLASDTTGMPATADSDRQTASMNVRSGETAI
jgi:[ribosomal protein S5]-alanine N-acetyltransferase